MPKLKKYPKKPKASASLSVMERYIERCKEVDRYNAALKKDEEKRKNLKKKITNMRR